jgi:hypothetical protein
MEYVIIHDNTLGSNIEKFIMILYAIIVFIAILNHERLGVFFKEFFDKKKVKEDYNENIFSETIDLSYLIIEK